MKPRLGMRKSGPLALAAALLFCATGLATSTAFGDGRIRDAEASTAGDDVREMEAQPPATFFTINAVLAKLDGQRAHRTDPVRLAALSPPPTVSDAQPQSGLPQATGTEPFGLFAFRAPDGMLWRKWRSVEGDMARDHALLAGCRSDAATCPPHAAQFLRLINAVKSKSGRAQLEEVNQGVNAAIRYVSDLAQFGELDRWSAALSSFATGKGDCEDYAIAKYAALREVGFPTEDMRILLVRDRSVRLDHAVLAARLDGRWLILDNRWSALREDSPELNFAPLFAIDHGGVHMFAKPYAQIPSDEGDAAPAAAAQEASEWTSADSSGAGGGSRLPLLL